MSVSTVTIPGYVVGTWTIDPVHSEIGFSVRHMMVSKVRGKFGRFSGEIVTDEDPLSAAVSATIELASIDTGVADRDAHIRSADFFAVETYPTMTYRSTSIHPDGENFVLDGELTLKGVTKSVPLVLEFGGITQDPYGGTRMGFSAIGEINRRDFGVDFNAALETGGLVVADRVTISLEIESVLNS